VSKEHSRHDQTGVLAGPIAYSAGHRTAVELLDKQEVRLFEVVFLFGLGTADVVRYTVDAREHEGWYYNKTLWAISPHYQGEVTISGEQLNESAELRFNPAAGFPGEKLARLEFESSDAAEWRYGPSDTLIRTDGCYAFRIEGEGFVEWVTFIARS
jgi:hypothetical protein